MSAAVTRVRRRRRLLTSTALPNADRLEAAARLASGIAHDLNNLLSVINGYCEMIALRVHDNPDATREIGEVYDAGRKAALLTQQLLTFSRQRPTRPRVVNLNSLLRTHEAGLRQLAGRARLAISLTEDIGNVRLDPEQFTEVLPHFVRNAAEAAGQGGCIQISTAKREVKSGSRNRRRTDPPPGTYVAMSISDSGPGVAPEARRHLFEPFFSTKPEGRGAGLGLALSRAIIEQSGGSFSVATSPEFGTIIEILLPAITGAIEAPAPSLGEAASSTRGTESLLIIEPDTVLRKMLEGIFISDGYRVRATAGENAAAKILREENESFDLVVAEAEMIGRPLRAALARHATAFAVLHLSGVSVGKSLDWLPRSRVASLAKPFALSELLHVARSLLDRANTKK